MRIAAARQFATTLASAKPYSILFFGREEYARVALYTLLNHEHAKSLIKRVHVVAPGATGSAGEALHEFLKSKDIQKFTFRKQFKAVENFIKTEQDRNLLPFDLGIVASFGQSIPEKINTMFPQGVIDVHPSLLPKYKGGSPIEHALLNKEKTTGISLLDISHNKPYAGKVMLSKECGIDAGDDYLSLAGKCGVLAGNALADVLVDLGKFRSEAKLPEESVICPAAPLIELKDAILLWDKLTSAEVVRKYIALRGSPLPSFSKVLLKSEWKMVHFDQIKEENDTKSEYYKKVLAPVDKVATPGVLHWSYKGMKDKICVKCKEGWVSAELVQMEGSARNESASNFIANKLKNTHYDETHSFNFRLALTKDITKLVEKIEI